MFLLPLQNRRGKSRKTKKETLKFMPHETFMTVREAADRLGKTQAAFFKMLERGIIPAYRRTNGLLISSLDLDAYRQRVHEARMERNTPKPKTHKRPGRVPRK